MLNENNSFNLIAQAVNEMLSVVQWIGVLSIGLQFIYKSYELIDVLGHRPVLTNLKQATQQQSVLVPCKTREQL